MRNPYLIALIVITAVSAAVGIILYIVGANTSNNIALDGSATNLGFIYAGTSWLTFGGFALLATLVLGGILWQPLAARPARPSSTDS